MKDVRISIRLTDEQHKQFKIVAIKNGTSMQELLIKCVNEIISKGDKNDEKEN